MTDGGQRVSGTKNDVDRAAFGLLERTQQVAPEGRDRLDGLPIVIDIAGREAAQIPGRTVLAKGIEGGGGDAAQPGRHATRQ
jgi:hypothetical protein